MSDSSYTHQDWQSAQRQQHEPSAQIEQDTYPSTSAHDTLFGQSALSSEGLLGQRGNVPVRQAAILNAQQHCGNRAVQRHLQRKSSNPGNPGSISGGASEIAVQRFPDFPDFDWIPPTLRSPVAPQQGGPPPTPPNGFGGVPQPPYPVDNYKPPAPRPPMPSPVGEPIPPTLRSPGTPQQGGPQGGPQGQAGPLIGAGMTGYQIGTWLAENTALGKGATDVVGGIDSALTWAGQTTGLMEQDKPEIDPTTGEYNPHAKQSALHSMADWAGENPWKAGALGTLGIAGAALAAPLAVPALGMFGMATGAKTLYNTLF